MSHLATTLSVGVPAEVAYDVVANPARALEWQTLLAELGPISGRPGGIGSSYVGYYRVAGRRLESRFVVTAAERPALHQVHGTTTGGWTRWTHLFETDGTRTTIGIDLEYELPGEIVGSLFAMLAGNRIQREFRRTYERLGEVLAREAARDEPASDGRTQRIGGGVADVATAPNLVAR